MYHISPRFNTEYKGLQQVTSLFCIFVNSNDNTTTSTTTNNNEGQRPECSKVCKFSGIGSGCVLYFSHN